ncbi:craniofacial development protein 2-like [Schistocerca americana]|uniref:craniofacial development protein 2-like n=1 Tax=Schistocerca americana TaxID=7009 RepID=UPI001F4FBE6C|nr:craniofacial development protein 2-like [Schistocerca americana]
MDASQDKCSGVIASHSDLRGRRFVKDPMVFKIRVRTLNVGTMTGNGREIVDMMQRRKIKVLCVQETRWKANKAKILAEGYKLLYSSANPETRNGVGVILHRELEEEACEVSRVNDRIMSVKMMFGGEMVTVLTAYAPQAGCPEDEKEKFWRDFDGVMVGIPENERVIARGDVNGHVGGKECGEERWYGG